MAWTFFQSWYHHWQLKRKRPSKNALKHDTTSKHYGWGFAGTMVITKILSVRWLNYQNLHLLVQETERENFIFHIAYELWYCQMRLSWCSFWLDHTTSSVGNGSFKPELQMTQVARNKCRTQKAGSVWCIILRELTIILIKHLWCCKCFGILGLAFYLQENIIPIALSYVWKSRQTYRFFPITKH